MDDSDLRGQLAVVAPITPRGSADTLLIEPSSDFFRLTVRDHRLVALASLLQASDPSSVGVLVTIDLNLQKQGCSMGLPHIEPPAPRGPDQSSELPAAAHGRGPARCLDPGVTFRDQGNPFRGFPRRPV